MKLASIIAFSFLLFLAQPVPAQDVMAPYDNSGLTPDAIPNEDPHPLADDTDNSSGANIYELNHDTLPDFDNQPQSQDLIPNDAPQRPDPNVLPDYVPGTVPEIQKIDDQSSPND